MNKNRYLSLLLAFLFVIMLIPAFAITGLADDSYKSESADGIMNPEDVSGNDLYLSKELTANSDGESYDLTLKSYATGRAVTEKIPTDFVLVIDQSGSMASNDMPSSYNKVESVNLEDIATGRYYYYDEALNQYYRVYPKTGYRYYRYDADTYYANDLYSSGKFHLFADEYTIADGASGYYFLDDGVYYPIGFNVRGVFVDWSGEDSVLTGLNYECYFKYTKNGTTISLRCPEGYTYHDYRQILGNRVDRWSEKLHFDAWKRLVGYNSLWYRDSEGEEHVVPTRNGMESTTYCNRDGDIAVTSPNGSIRMTYSGLYQGVGNKRRLDELGTALNAFAEAVANETDSFGPVDNKVAIVGFSSENSGSSNKYNNTEVLTGSTISTAQNRMQSDTQYQYFPYNGAYYTSTNSGANNGTNYNGPQYYKYSSSNGYNVQVDNTVYKNALIKAYGSQTSDGYAVSGDLTKSIKSVTAYGGTQPEDGFEMAYQILNNSGRTKKYTIRTGDRAGSTVARNQVVIFFTDGRPGNNDEADQYIEANEVVAAAKKVKGIGASVFSIGVFDESDGNPLSYVRNQIKNGNLDSYYYGYTNDSDYEEHIEDYKYDSDYIGQRTRTHSIAWSTTSFTDIYARRWKSDDVANYGNKANDTIFDYMSVVSSNYPNAISFVPTTIPSGSNYITQCNSLRGTGSEGNQYYRMASNQKALVEAFLDAVTMTNQETSLSKETLELFDQINLDDFDISSDSTATAYTVLGEYSNNSVTLGSAPLKTVSVEYENGSLSIPSSSFDYSNADNFITKTKAGKGLVVTITGLKPKRLSEALYSNEDAGDPSSPERAGIYTVKNGVKDTDLLSIASPKLDSTKKYFAVHEVSVDASDVSSPVDGETTLYPIQNKFNIVEIATNQEYLYGGVYEKFEGGKLKNPMTLGSETGLEFTPTAGTEYVLKEVPNTYLKTKNLRRFNAYNGQLHKSFLLSAVDSGNDYKQVGYVVNENGETKYLPSLGNTVYSRFVLSNGALGDSSDVTTKVYVPDKTAALKNTDLFTPVDGGYSIGEVKIKGGTATPKILDKNIISAFEGNDGFLDVLEVDASKTPSGQAYWLTKDGVLVTGDNVRKLKTDGNKDTAAEQSGKKAAVKNTVINTASIADESFAQQSMFVSADNVEVEDSDLPANSDVDLVGYTTSLNGNIALNLYMKLSDDVVNAGDAYMQFEMPGLNHTDATVPVSKATKTTRDGQTCYVFSAGVAAKNMTDNINAKFYRGDTLVAEYNYSIKDYCDTIIANAKGEYKDSEIAVANAMLNYGGYAQVFFDYNTTDLANADIDKTLPEVKLGSEYDVVKEGTCTGVQYRGSRAMLTTTTDIRHYLNIEGDAGNYTFEANGKELAVQEDTTGTYVAIENIPAKNMRDMMTLTVTNKEDGSTFRLSYSVYTNINRIVNNDTGKYREESKNVMRAMYQYGEAAYRYFKGE